MSNSQKVWLNDNRPRKVNRWEIHLPLSDKTFKNQKALKTYVDSITPTIVDVIIDKDHEHYLLLCDLLKRNTIFDIIDLPDHFLLKKKGINLFRTEKFRPFFRVEEETEWIGWSIQKGITNRTVTSLALYKRALRDTITPQIDQFRKLKRFDKCNECKGECDQGYDIDHVIPFAKLITMWSQDHPEYFQSEITEKGIFYEIVDENLRSSWALFHFDNATLQKLCRKCHTLKTNPLKAP